MRVLLCNAFILISLLTTGVYCQDGGGSWWQELIDFLKESAREFRDRFRELWDKIKDQMKVMMTEMKERMTDFKGWTEETWISMKKAWVDMVNKDSEMSETDKEDMRNFIERMEMPTEGSD